MKTYKVNNLQQALQQIKQDLGENAVIIQSKEVPKRRWLGFLSSKVLEVTAAEDGYQKPQKQEDMSSLASALALNNLRVNEITQKFERIEETLQVLLNNQTPQLPEQLKEVYEHLIDRGLAPRYVFDLLKDVQKDVTTEKHKDFPFILSYLTMRVAEKLHTGADFKDYFSGNAIPVLALIGSTGVGKTTTIAKLAANFALSEKKRLGLLTIDTYRMGGYEQLKSFGDLMSIDVKVVQNQVDLHQALQSFADKDMVLIDTVGRSPQNFHEIQKMFKMLNSKQFNIGYHLVINANMDESSMLASYQSFSRFKLDSLIFSKMDEAVNLGNVYSFLAQVPKKLSYLTSGQRVPEDIEVADRLKLAGKIIGEQKHVRSSKHIAQMV